MKTVTVATPCVLLMNSTDTNVRPEEEFFGRLKNQKIGQNHGWKNCVMTSEWKVLRLRSL